MSTNDRYGFAAMVRALVLVATFGVTLAFTTITGGFLAYLLLTDSLWPLVYILGVPLAATLFVDRRYFR